MAEMLAYVLDTSVASLILDGELWTREPGVLVGYKKDLQTSLFHTEKKKTLTDLQQESMYLQRAVNAHAWAKSVIGTGRTKLLLTPTVQVELALAPQVRAST